MHELKRLGDYRTNRNPEMALDGSDGKMYWPDGVRIRRANRDGSDAQDIVYMGLTAPYGVALATWKWINEEIRATGSSASITNRKEFTPRTFGPRSTAPSRR